LFNLGKNYRFQKKTYNRLKLIKKKSKKMDNINEKSQIRK